MTEPIRRTMLDDESAASDPGRLALSDERLRRLRPDLYGIRGLIHRIVAKVTWWAQLMNFPHRRFIAEQLWWGDARAAVVVSVNPVLVAAYADELDCVAILKFPDETPAWHPLQKGDRLITVNTYEWTRTGQNDIVLGKNHLGNYTGFLPIIADFITDDTERLDELRRAIGDDEWERASKLASEYHSANPGWYRDGRPPLARWRANAIANSVTLMIVVATLIVLLLVVVLWKFA